VQTDANGPGGDLECGANLVEGELGSVAERQQMLLLGLERRDQKP
jgi:hypothetical protein